MSEELLNSESDADPQGADKQGAGESKPAAAADDAKPGNQEQGKPSSDAADKKVDAQGAPEAYADFTLPEGKTLAADLVDEIKAVAKDLGLPQDKAQKLVDLAVARTDKTSKAQADVVEKARTEWAEQTQSDKELGGEKLQANLGVAKRALDAFGSKELKTLLKESGLGNHPEVIRFFYKAGKAIGNDDVLTGRQSKPAKDIASVLYPNSQS